MQARAKLFLSFDALKGFSELIHDKEKIVVSKKELSEDDCYELDWKIHQLEVGKMCKIVYFEKGQYIQKEGMVSFIDLDIHKIIAIVKTMIPIESIVSIEYAYYL